MRYCEERRLTRGGGKKGGGERGGGRRRRGSEGKRERGERGRVEGKRGEGRKERERNIHIHRKLHSNAHSIRVNVDRRDNSIGRVKALEIGGTSSRERSGRGGCGDEEGRNKVF